MCRRASPAATRNASRSGHPVATWQPRHPLRLARCVAVNGHLPILVRCADQPRRWRQRMPLPERALSPQGHHYPVVRASSSRSRATAGVGRERPPSPSSKSGARALRRPRLCTRARASLSACLRSIPLQAPVLSRDWMSTRSAVTNLPALGRLGGSLLRPQVDQSEAAPKGHSAVQSADAETAGGGGVSREARCAARVRLVWCVCAPRR